jgi:hypothetical protein
MMEKLSGVSETRRMAYQFCRFRSSGLISDASERGVTENISTISWIGNGGRENLPQSGWLSAYQLKSIARAEETTINVEIVREA